MKNKFFSFLLMAFVMLSASNVFGQGTLTGKITDANGETIPGVNILEKGTTNGVTTSIDGDFSLKTTTNEGNIVISFVGYSKKEISFNLTNSKTVGTVKLENKDIGIAEVSVLASIAVDRKTPVAVSTIDPEVILEKLGTKEFPEILSSTPSVYATKSGGGYGDGRINLRGFDSRNVAVLINGVPVNDMENGKVYWSNWAGLSDVTRSMQVQRGLGASKVAIPSVGGTINILTKTTDVKKGGNVFYGIGNDGYVKKGFLLSTGLTDKGWAATILASKTNGNGYVQGTKYDAYSYFVNVSKSINENHKLSLSVVGAPQWHGQRYDRMRITDYKSKPEGIKYNGDWGYKNGEEFNLRKNFYHKPQAILNHFWNVSSNLDISTALYASTGTGGGTGPYGNYSKFSYRRDGLIDFDRIVDENAARGDLGSDAILRSSVNNHQWYGMLTNVSYALNSNLTVSGGIDLRYYRGEHYREVTDLLGGSYYMDDDDVNDPIKIARTGDIIDYHNDGLVKWAGTFAQVEYTKENLTIFAAGSFSAKSYKRIDYFAFTPEEGQETEWENLVAFSGKGGGTYNINDNHFVFVNAGYFERQPDFNSVYINYGNNLNTEAVNEKVLSFELGYGFRSKMLNANLNLYNTDWQDKSFIRSFEQADGEYYTANLLGVDATHRGVELDFELKPIKNLTVTGMFSIGDWRWKNDLEGQTVTNDNQEVVGEVDLYIKDVPVGDAAQTTAAFGVNYKVLKSVKIGVDYRYYDRLFAKFDPIAGGYDAPLADGGNVTPWQLPIYHLLDANIKYSFKLGDFDASLYANVDNILDIEYIADAEDGSGHNWETANVWYGLGRTWSLSFKIKF